MGVTVKKILCVVGVVGGILMIVVPSLVGTFHHPIPDTVTNSLTVIGVVIALGSLVFL